MFVACISKGCLEFSVTTKVPETFIEELIVSLTKSLKLSNLSEITI